MYAIRSYYVPLPLGMRLFHRDGVGVPWSWGINSATSVLGAILAVILAMNFGFNVTLLCGEGVYALALLPVLLVITSYSIHYTKLYDIFILPPLLTAAMTAPLLLRCLLAGGVGRGVRITSYNVCYTKLLRYNFKLEDIWISRHTITGNYLGLNLTSVFLKKHRM